MIHPRDLHRRTRRGASARIHGGPGLARALLGAPLMRFVRSLVASLVLAVTVPACDGGGAPTADEQDATAASGRFETFVGEDGRHYFHLRARNGERILASQGYASASAAADGIAAVKKNGGDDARYARLVADNGEHYFNLRSGNGRVIATSETYASRSNADRGIAAVKRAIGSAVSDEAEGGDVRFETVRGSDGKTYVHLRAANGQIVLQTQGYSSRGAAEDGIEAIEDAAVDADRFEVFEGADGQHTFRLTARNGAILGRGEMYASKSNALRGAARVRELVRELTGAGEPTAADLKGEIARVSEGLWYTSEGDYPFTFVEAAGATRGPVTEALVRSELGALVDAEPDADKPMADLVAMEESWDDWKAAEHACHDVDVDDFAREQCTKMRGLEQVLEANLEDVRVFYFGSRGEPGMVEGTAVSVFIVGWTPEGELAGVRTIAIWT